MLEELDCIYYQNCKNYYNYNNYNNYKKITMRIPSISSPLGDKYVHKAVDKAVNKAKKEI